MAKRAETPITKLTPKAIADLETKLKQFVANVKSHGGLRLDKMLAGHGSHFQQ
jgi:hypothetical protein